MPAEPLFSYDHVDFEHPMADLEAVKAINPHRGAMIQIDGVATWSDDFAEGVGWRDVRDGARHSDHGDSARRRG